MGSGTWSTSTYHSVTRTKIDSGSSFSYDSAVKSGRARGAHEDLSPAHRNSEGKVIREARDSAEHPNSLPIILGFDGTGSQGDVPFQAIEEFPKLFGLLLKKGYAVDPQIANVVYGDAYVDDVPLQFSQFESDNRIDDSLDKIYVEHGGGGNSGETQSLLWEFINRHVVTDAWEKRGKKGYLFLLADEVSLPIRKEHYLKAVGMTENEAGYQDAPPMEAQVEALTEKWNVYIILHDNWVAKNQGSRAFYTRLFGEDHVIPMESMKMVVPTIATIIGVSEGNVTANGAEEDLVEVGLTLDSAKRVTGAIAGKVSTEVAVSMGDLGDSGSDVATL